MKENHLIAAAAKAQIEAAIKMLERAQQNIDALSVPSSTTHTTTASMIEALEHAAIGLLRLQILARRLP